MAWSRYLTIVPFGIGPITLVLGPITLVLGTITLVLSPITLVLIMMMIIIIFIFIVILGSMVQQHIHGVYIWYSPKETIFLVLLLFWGPWCSNVYMVYTFDARQRRLSMYAFDAHQRRLSVCTFDTHQRRLSFLVILSWKLIKSPNLKNFHI